MEYAKIQIYSLAAEKRLDERLDTYFHIRYFA